MNKIVYDLLLKLEQCDDKHNRCDYLMEHDEITYLLEYIEEKDKEIERLKAREQECIDKYLAESKYRGEVEGKYVLAKYVIDELEKYLNDDDWTSVNGVIAIKLIKIKLKELKEGK